jgi:hypothetical protein
MFLDESGRLAYVPSVETLKRLFLEIKRERRSVNP